ncbi:hypothetical protein M422DRAFT_261643 [Sphaerobolus stellatus SS14]|uniref:Unplaced genomic scaffold SPHSTscaffold_107, whole genome shotgun sequence n=1 Tax=Sphaerobolus stellatus (strain SS14) TaxID=990650 RepID=A0A0C9VEP4_SPHS4|nr:hypothetical protein M422DRAFT_261643 [Sphaerobolus stellatus SS14]
MQQALESTADGHPEKATHLNNLGNSLSGRFGHGGKTIDIENAITALQEAVNLTPDGHIHQVTHLNNLGSSFDQRFEHLGEYSDIEKSIAALQKVTDLTPDGHADTTRNLMNLGKSFKIKFDRLGDFHDIEKAIIAYSGASKIDSSSPSVQYLAAMEWASLCSRYQSPSSTLEAYRVILEIMPQRAWLGQKVACRYKELLAIGSAVNAAAAMAITSGDMALALEWLEGGRSIVWGQILQLHTPIDDLQVKHPALAEDLYRVSRALENAGTSTVINGLENPGSRDPEFSQEVEAQAHRALAEQYRKLIEEVRKLDGFECFLKPKTLSNLLPASQDGPVVIVNITESRCDALILYAHNFHEPITHVHLQNFSHKQADKLYSQMNSILETRNVCYSRKMMFNDTSAQNDVKGLESVLANLWSGIVSPVWLKIKDMIPDSAIDDFKPHIMWCATGPLAFLPLHAAGVYCSADSSKQVKISDFMVSSYTPTLTTLLRPHNEPSISPPKVLIISQPNTPHQCSLPETIRETEAIRKLTTAEVLDHTQATIPAVLEAMGEQDWVHLACHGIQDAKDPIKSAFALYDGKLELESLMAKRLDRAELAFLSACQTATGDTKLPNEAVHLAAGMLAAGFQSVIATMWSIGDDDGPEIAEAFYSILFY